MSSTKNNKYGFIKSQVQAIANAIYMQALAEMCDDEEYMDEDIEFAVERVKIVLKNLNITYKSIKHHTAIEVMF